MGLSCPHLNHCYSHPHLRTTDAAASRTWRPFVVVVATDTDTALASFAAYTRHAEPEAAFAWPAEKTKP